MQTVGRRLEFTLRPADARNGLKDRSVRVRSCLLRRAACLKDAETAVTEPHSVIRLVYVLGRARISPAPSRARAILRKPGVGPVGPGDGARICESNGMRDPDRRN